MKKLIFCVIAFFGMLGISSLALADELYHPLHGGELIKHKRTGLDYEVVRTPKEVVVYPTKDEAPVPKMITIQFKNEKGIMDSADLKLLPSKEAKAGYTTGPLPQRVLVSGGVTFNFK
jgi:hypothetical protein